MEAKANPEKRLFISLITRDISLIAAILDLIDNSINSALEPYAESLKSAQDYEGLLANSEVSPSCHIDVEFDEERLVIRDNAAGISTEAAANGVFKFGRASAGEDPHDRLSVYGIGLKRAIFKVGNRIRMTSDHAQGGFELDLDVAHWATTPQEAWAFDISPRQAKASGTGTRIEIEEFYDEVRQRFRDGTLEGQLKEQISRTYTAFIGRIVTISVNGDPVEGLSFNMGDNFNGDRFELEGVSCTVTAGIAAQKDGRFKDSGSGWFVFCNGRTVIFADKTSLTGWSGEGLPIYQPKHRPFIGLVFFFSPDPEKLPWTTTKAGINTESLVWQTAKRQMAMIARPVITFLDSRYTSEGTEVKAEQLQGASGLSINLLSVAAAEKRAFAPPRAPKPKEIRIQYHALVADIEEIERYLKQPGLGGAGVGRYTFDYFLRNEVRSS